MPAEDFRGFVSLVAQPVLMAYTSKEYAAMSDKARQSAKSTRFFTAACFDEMHCQKADSPATTFGLICIDIDAHNSAKNWISDVEGRIPWAHLIYHSLSSTEASVRIRIVIGCEQTPIEHYQRMTEYMAEFLDVEIDPKSLSPRQAMYYPSMFSDSTVSPIVSRGCALPLLTLDETPEIAMSSKTYQSARMGAEERPLVGVALGHAEEMLSHIDPDCDYTTWCAVCCSLQHQFAQRNEDEARDAFLLFNAWSAKGLKYSSEDATYRKWKAFRAFGQRASITMRSLIHFAVLGGWEADQVAADAYKQMQTTISTAGGDLMTKVMRQLARHELLSDIDKDALLRDVQKRAALEHSRTYQLPMLRSILKDMVLEANRKSPNDSWTAPWCYLACYHAWLNLSLPAPDKLRPEAFDYLNSGQECDGRKPSAYALEHGARKVETTTYNPKTTERFIQITPNAYALNMYQASYATPDPSREAEAAKVFDDHLAYMLADPRHARLLKSWMAWVVQNPGRKAMWAPVLQGVQGSGKSVLFLALCAVLGTTNTSEVSKARMDSQWNDWAQGKMFLLFEEVDLGTGEAARTISDRLKTLITGETLPLNQRGRDSRDVPNYANCVFLLNDLSRFPVDANERRFFVLRCKQQRREDLEKNTEYWDNVYRLKGELAGGLRFHLMTMTLDPEFDATGHAPMTVFRDTASNTAQSPIERIIRSSWNNNCQIQQHIVSQRAVEIAVANADLEYGTNSVIKALIALGYTMAPHPTKRSELDEADQIWYSPLRIADMGIDATQEALEKALPAMTADIEFEVAMSPKTAPPPPAI